MRQVTKYVAPGCCQCGRLWRVTRISSYGLNGEGMPDYGSVGWQNFINARNSALQANPALKPLGFALPEEKVDGRILDEESRSTRFGSISNVNADSLLAISNAALVEHRAIRVATEQMASILSSLTVAVPTLRVPSLPPGAGAGVGSGGAIQIIINVNGPVMGQTAAQAGAQMAEAALPFFNAALARAAGVEARLAGVPLS